MDTVEADNLVRRVCRQWHQVFVGSRCLLEVLAYWLAAAVCCVGVRVGGTGVWVGAVVRVEVTGGIVGCCVLVSTMLPLDINQRLLSGTPRWLDTRHGCGGRRAGSRRRAGWEEEARRNGDCIALRCRDRGRSGWGKEGRGTGDGGHGGRLQAQQGRFVPDGRGSGAARTTVGCRAVVMPGTALL